MYYMTKSHTNYPGLWMTVYKQDYLVVTIKTCSDASIALSQLAGISEVSAYEIEIQLTRTTVYYRIYDEGKSVKDGSSLNLKDCEKTEQEYWIGWRNGTIEIGKGTLLGQTKQLDYYDPDPHNVNFLGFASKNDTRWYFHDVQGNAYAHRTSAVSDGDPPSYNDLWIVPLRHVNSLSFGVISCFDARIALSADGNSTKKAYEILIDRRLSDNTYVSSIRKTVGGPDEANTTLEGILHCQHRRQFWISWDDNTIRLGLGATGSFTFLEWHIPILSRHTVRSIAFGSGSTQPANWQFGINEAEVVHGVTYRDAKDEGKFWLTVHGQKLLFFQVKTCDDATVYLTSILYESRTESYKIAISEQGVMLVDLGTGRILDVVYPSYSLLFCMKYETFWLSWHDNELMIGRGPVFRQDVLLQYTFNSMYPIYSVGFDSHNSGGSWTFLRSQGDYRTYTSPDFEYGVAVVNLHDQEDYLFNIKACANAYLLMAWTENWQKDSLELIIGAYENTKVELRYKGEETPEKSVEAVGILSCDNLRSFWLDWKHGQIRFGMGDKGDNELLSWHFHEPGGLPMPFPLSFITPATVGYAGEWDLAQKYPETACGEVMRQVASIDEGYQSDCTSVDWLIDLTIEQCKEEACLSGANVINYDPSYPDCKMVCCSGNDYKLVTRTYAYDVYSLELEGETFVAKTSKQLGLNFEQHWVSVSGNTGIAFKVKACSEVHLALASAPGISTTLAYEVVIGGTGNTYTAIRTDVGNIGETVKRVSTPGVLQCGKFEHLWVSWKDNLISAGQSSLVGSEPFIEWYAGVSMFPINAVGISSELDFDGTFMFGNIKDVQDPPLRSIDETYSMHTTGSGSFNTHRWSISKGYLLFELMACSDAQIILAAVPENYTGEAYRIDLGTENNQKTTITKLPEDSMTSVKSDTPNVLNCTVAKPFWVQWTQTTITVGFGPLGLNALATLQDNNMPSRFNEMAVSTTNMKSGYWDVKKSAGHVFSFTTPDTSEYKEIWRTTKNYNYIVFSVKASSDAHILLSTQMKNTGGFVYEIVLGMQSNTDSGIRKCKQCNTVVRERTDQILSPTEFRAFWIRWYQGVEVGYGTQVGARPFMRLSELTTYPFEAMSVMTGWGATGVWHFSDIDGDGFYLNSAPNPQYTHIWVYEQTHFFEFSVRSCEKANIFLSETPFLALKTRPGYEIHIDGSEAGLSQIMKYPIAQNEDPVKANATTPGVLHCDYFTKLWISWLDGMIRVGHGTVFENTFLFYRNDKPFPMRAVSLATPLIQKTNAEWQFAKNAGKSTIFQTPNGKDFLDWHTVDVTTTFIYLRVTACSNAEILLSSSPGVTYGHKIILGMDDERSVLMVPGTEEIVNFKLGNPLQCTTGVWFWLSWYKGVIAMGHGFESGSDIIVAYDTKLEGKTFEFGAIGFRTTKQVGTWEFSQMEGGEIEVSTAGAKGYKHAWLLTSFHAFHFKVQACNDATIALAEDSSEFDIHGTKSYELKLGTNGTKRIELWKYTEAGESILLKSVDTDGLLLDCDKFTQFWLTWGSLDDQRLFRLGLGPDLFDLQIFEYEDTQKPYQISSIGFASENSKVAKWVFKDDAAAITRLHTNALYTYDKFLYHVATKLSLIFKVKAAHNAHVALFEHYHADKAYEFVIGMSGNNYTAIREGLLQPPVAYRRTPNILADTEYRLFWVSWSNNRLALGRGSVVGREELISYNSQKIPFIQYLSMSTWLTAPGSWEILPERYNTLQFRTPSDQVETSTSFEFGEAKKDMTFEVRACSEAQIRFRPQLEEDPNYELIIGGNDNTQTKLYRDGNMVHEKDMMDVLSCSTYRKFWLSWSEGQFILAKGSLMGQRILEWKDSDPLSIHSLSIATGLKQMGDWNIPRYDAPHVRYLAYAHRAYEGFWMTVSELTSYVFHIKAHSHANILLTDVPGVTTRTAYEIIIGADFNLNTKIRELKSNKLLVSKPTRGILSDEVYQWFWVSWGHYKEDKNGLIKFGKGIVPGQEEVISASMTDPIDINGLGFSASNSVNVSWELMSYTDGNFYMLRTDNVTYDNGAWLTPIDQRLSFQVKGCFNARIALLTDKYNKDRGYEVLLGGFDNTGSGIFSGAEGKDSVELVTATGAGTLDCTRSKQFWISWDSIHLRVGEGYTDTAPFLHYQTRMGNLEQINVLGFTSTETSKAEWRIPQNQENSLVLTSQPTGAHGQHWLTLGAMDRVVLRVKACEMAKILLVAKPDDTLSTTEIVIGLNNKTVIRDAVGEVKASADTPGVLDCDHFSSFWIHWRSDRIYVGRGTRIYQHSMVKYEADTLHDIQSMSLASGLGPQFDGDGAKPAIWQIFGFRGNLIKAYTPKELKYDAIDIYPEDPDDFYTSFRVRACNSAHFIIAPKTNMDTGTYDVIFGSNDNSKYEILKGGKLLQSVIAYNILSAEQFRNFWVSWREGNLTAGRGEVGQYHAIANYDSSAPTMYSASFSTSNTCPGNWDIDQRVGDCIQVHTPGEYAYNRIHVMMMDSYSFVFKVKAASSVHIALSVVPTVTQTETWEIGLQANNGKENFIRNKVKGTVYLSRNSRTNILDKTKFRTFWISWKKGRIAIGKESIVGLLEIVAAKVDNVPDIGSVAFTTALFVPGDWQFKFRDHLADLSTTTTSATTTTTTPTTTTTTKSTSTKSTSRSTTSTNTGRSSTTSSGPTQSTTEKAVNPGGNGEGLSGGQVAGVVIGVLLGVVLLMLLALLLTLRYKPDAIPQQAASFIPVVVLQKVRRDYVSSPVHFTNPIFGEDDGLNQNKISFGAVDTGEPLNDFSSSDT